MTSSQLSLMPLTAFAAVVLPSGADDSLLRQNMTLPTINAMAIAAAVTVMIVALALDIALGVVFGSVMV
jgi:branched-subunit amino acid transport protein